jgi:hypothetical protein
MKDSLIPFDNLHLPAIVRGPTKELFVRKSDIGKSIIPIYNEHGKEVGFAEDLVEPLGAIGPPSLPLIEDEISLTGSP